MIQNVANGRIEVKSWKNSEVDVIANQNSGKIGFEMEQAGDRIDVTANVLDSNAQPIELETSLQLAVPEETELQLKTQTGLIYVEQVMGDMTLESVAGDVHLKEVSGYIIVRTTQGSLVCTQCAGKLEFESVGGSAQILQPALNKVNLHTSFGNILFDGDFVRTGLYAYVSNSMQLCTASGWLVIGAVLANIWVACAAVMAVCFVLGMVRWHHRQDLEIRFPQGWPEYRAHVPEWWPRWRPWIPIASKLRYDPTRPFHRCLISGLAQLGAQGLDLRPEAGCLCYQEANETREFRGLAAMGKALNPGNLVTAILGSALLLIVLPAGYLARLVAASLTCVQARQRA